MREAATTFERPLTLEFEREVISQMSTFVVASK